MPSKVLVVDDDDAIRSSLQLALELEGYEVRQFAPSDFQLEQMLQILRGQLEATRAEVAIASRLAGAPGARNEPS